VSRSIFLAAVLLTGLTLIALGGALWHANMVNSDLLMMGLADAIAAA